MNTRKKNFCAIMGVALGIGCSLSVQASLKNLKNDQAVDRPLLGKEQLNPEKREASQPAISDKLRLKQSQDKLTIIDASELVDEQKVECEDFMLNWLDGELKQLSGNSSEVDNLKRKFDKVDEGLEAMFQGITTFSQFDEKALCFEVFDRTQKNDRNVQTMMCIKELRRRTHCLAVNKNSIDENNALKNARLIKLLEGHKDKGVCTMSLELSRDINILYSKDCSNIDLEEELDKIKRTLVLHCGRLSDSKKLDKKATRKSLLRLALKKDMQRVIIFGAKKWR